MGGKEVASVRDVGERRGMKQPEIRRCQRRCCECRGWYTPTRSTTKTQMTCGKGCRLRRRAKQEKARRAADLADSRVADRVRQREHRLRKRTGGEERPVSQAGLAAQVTESIDQIIEKLRQEQRLSQAGLRRQLYRLAHAGRGQSEHAAATRWT